MSLFQEVENFQRLGPSCEQIIEYYRAWQEARDSPAFVSFVCCLGNHHATFSSLQLQEGFFFVQMELCERGNLENFLKALFAEGRLVPESTVWTWVRLF